MIRVFFVTWNRDTGRQSSPLKKKKNRKKGEKGKARLWTLAAGPVISLLRWQIPGSVLCKEVWKLCCFPECQLSLSGAHQLAPFGIWYSRALSSGPIGFARVLTPAPRPASKFRCGLTVLRSLSNSGLPWTLAPQDPGVFDKGVITLGLELKAAFFAPWSMPSWAPSPGTSWKQGLFKGSPSRLSRKAAWSIEQHSWSCCSPFAHFAKNWPLPTH